MMFCERSAKALIQDDSLLARKQQERYNLWVQSLMTNEPNLADEK